MSIPFENGTNLSQDNTHFTWDYTNFLLKVLGKFRSYESTYSNNKYLEIYKDVTTKYAIYNFVETSTGVGHFFTKNGSSTFQFVIEDDGIFFGQTEHQSIINVTNNYSAGNLHSVIFCDASGGAFTVTLPAISNLFPGKHYYVIKTDSSANAITIARGSASDTFVGTGTTSLNLSTQGSKANLISNDAHIWGVF